MAVELENRDPLLLRVSGDLSEDNGRELFTAVTSLVAARRDKVVVELSAVDFVDSAGCAYLFSAQERAREGGLDLSIQGARGGPSQFISLFTSSLARSKPLARPRVGFLEGIGDTVFAAFDEMKQFGSLMVETVYWSFIAPFEKKGVRWAGVWDETYEIGFRAVGIVMIINVLLGLIIAMLSAAQLKMFNAEIYVADLVTIAFTRELAALMTGIVVAARSGSAIAAELATMVVQEEIDALKSMGFNPTKYLVTPKIFSMVLCVPALTILAMVAGISAAMILGVFQFGIGAEVWLDETVAALTIDNIALGLAKSLCYALVIVIVGCHNGLRVKGGARGVGIVTTRSVVMDIFFIIVVAAIFAAVSVLTT